MNALWTSGILGYGVLFAAASAGLFHWRLRSRSARPPVEFRLLRGPGELTQRSIRKLDSGLPLLLLISVLAPLLGGLALFVLVRTVPAGTGQILSGVGAGLLFAGGVFMAGRLVAKQLDLRRALELRLLGEKAVAEELAPLLANGCRLYHDVAILGAGEQLDLDHVLVGPNGVTLIETETRQRDTKSDGPRQHEVAFDGKQLVWPWGADRDSISNVETQAVSLSKWLSQSTGLRTAVKPMLVLPGWWIDSTSRGTVEVLNHKQVYNAAATRSDTALSATHMEQICKALDEHCRDVTA